MQIDRRLLGCIMTFGLVTTYMYLPYGFGEFSWKANFTVGNINKSGLDVSNECDGGNGYSCFGHGGRFVACGVCELS